MRKKITKDVIKRLVYDKNWKRTLKKMGYSEESLFKYHYATINEVIREILKSWKHPLGKHTVYAHRRALISFLMSLKRKRCLEVRVNGYIVAHFHEKTSRDEIKEKYGSSAEIVEVNREYTEDDIKEILGLYDIKSNFILEYIKSNKIVLKGNYNGSRKNVKDTIYEGRQFMYKSLFSGDGTNLFAITFKEKYENIYGEDVYKYVDDYDAILALLDCVFIDDDVEVFQRCCASALGLEVKGENAVEPFRSIYLENNKSKEQKKAELEEEKKVFDNSKKLSESVQTFINTSIKSETTNISIHDKYGSLKTFLTNCYNQKFKAPFTLGKLRCIFELDKEQELELGLYMDMLYERKETPNGAFVYLTTNYKTKMNEEEMA